MKIDIKCHLDHSLGLDNRKLLAHYRDHDGFRELFDAYESINEELVLKLCNDAPFGVYNLYAREAMAAYYLALFSPTPKRARTQTIRNLPGSDAFFEYVLALIAPDCAPIESERKLDKYIMVVSADYHTMKDWFTPEAILALRLRRISRHLKPYEVNQGSVQFTSFDDIGPSRIEADHHFIDLGQNLDEEPPLKRSRIGSVSSSVFKEAPKLQNPTQHMVLQRNSILSDLPKADIKDYPGSDHGMSEEDVPNAGLNLLASVASNLIPTPQGFRFFPQHSTVIVYPSSTFVLNNR